MMKKEIKNFKDIKLNITNKMYNDFIEYLVVEQMIKEKQYENAFELKLLNQYKKVLQNRFINNFRQNNKEQIQQYLDLMNK